MKKSIFTLGKILKKEELKTINGNGPAGDPDSDNCGWGFCINSFDRCSILACQGHMI